MSNYDQRIERLNNIRTMGPNWKEYTKSEFDDGKFNLEYARYSFPGYLDNDLYPFVFCRSLTYGFDGKTSNRFCGTDSPENFERNIKTQPADWRYRNKEIEYLVNSNGYRTREWEDINWKESIVIIGCSNTFGVGLAEDETISYFVEQSTGRQTINLGYPSGSNELILHNSLSLYEKFGAPYSVVLNWSTPDRFRCFEKNDYLDLGPWNHQTIEYAGELFKLTTLDEYNIMCRNFYIGKTAKIIWQDRTKYIAVSYFDIASHYMRADNFFEIDNKARDLLHPGVDNSREVAEYIVDRLRN
jgi:hypothetical protein